MRFNFKLEEIKYIKIIYKDNNGTGCVTKAGIKKFDDREILACGKFENGLNIETPQEIVLSVVCNDGLYRTKTLLKSVENDEPYVFFILETPNGIEYEQNREYFRVPVKYNCIYKVKDNNEIREIAAITYDISANGISIITPNHFISENLSELIINIDGISINTKIKYIRSEKVNEGYRLSFSYVGISELDRDYISQVCIKKQLEQRRNLLR